MAVVEVSSEEEYLAATATTSLAVIHFAASWAEECATVSAVLGELARELQGRATFHTLQAEALPEVS